MAESNEQLLAELASDKYRIAALSRPFKPWHRPRKQHVRRVQIDGHLESVFEANDGPIRYLGMPGSDLLDLRWIHGGMCERLGRRLLFIGFDMGDGDDETRFSIEAAKLGMSDVDERSDIIPTKFQSLADADSIAYQKALRIGSFDIVNIDLCNGVASEMPSASVDTMYDAIANLIGLQVSRVKPWVLMLTTRIDRSNVNSSVGNQLAAIIDSNIRDCHDFREAIQAAYGQQHTRFQTLSGIGAATVAQLRSVGLAKWIIHLAATKQMAAALVSAETYTVRPSSGHPDLLSMAFVVQPPVRSPAADSFRLAMQAHGGCEVDECEPAVAALGTLRSAADVDSLLSQDTALYQQARAESADLLVQAGYDRELYFEWLDNQMAEV